MLLFRSGVEDERDQAVLVGSNREVCHDLPRGIAHGLRIPQAVGLVLDALVVRGCIGYYDP